MQAKRDQNRQVAWIGVSSVDGVTPIPLTVDPITGRLRVVVMGHGVDPTPSDRAVRDENRVPAKIAQEKDADVITAFVVNVATGLMMEGP